MDSCSTWNVGYLIEFRHRQGDGGDAAGEEGVRRCEQIGAVIRVAGASNGRIYHACAKGFPVLYFFTSRFTDLR